MEKQNGKTIPGLEKYQKELQKYQEEHDKLTLLLNVARNISRELKIDRLLMLIMDEVKKVLECDRCTVFVLDRERSELWSRVAHGEKEIRFPSNLGIAGDVATTGKVLNIPDAYSDSRFNPNIDKITGLDTLDSIKKVVTSKTKIVIITHIAGLITVELEDILDFCHANDIKVIEDSAQTLGAKYTNEYICSYVMMPV